ncbi:DUF2490 domain-containing protein [Flavobacterium sp.]|uniref:DUF2490 domain-containing protein n=1 Tax=Flavobacterium sp. TaxID=239 RepID=UPI003B99A305
MPLKFRFPLLFVFLSIGINAQTTRITDRNNIGWYNYFGTFKVANKWSVHTEYQWRRAETISNPQQSLLRLGANYQANPKLQLRLGYAWIETYAYGDIPLNGFGKTFTEHRIFQMATITDKIWNIDLSHRFMLEQRWVGRFNSAAATSEDEYLFLNRLRYMFRLQIPLAKNPKPKTPYLAVYDEIFLGFGEDIGANVFDQNRLGLLLGCNLTSNFKIEAGYLNQIVQFGRNINNQDVYQYNNGLIVNTIFNFDFRKNKETK